jgi:predicted small lipoprotein YifL
VRPRRAILRLFLGTVLLAAATACGKKGPPTRPGDEAENKSKTRIYTKRR